MSYLQHSLPEGNARVPEGWGEMGVRRKEITWKLAVVLKLTESHHKKQKESPMCENIENALQFRAFIPGNRLKSACLI